VSPVVALQPESRRKEEWLSFAAACACAGERQSRAAAFPGGDLPEAPGGKKAALSRFATARFNYFPPPLKRAALHRQAK